MKTSELSAGFRKSFISLFRQALFLAWRLAKQNLFVKEKKSQKAMAFPKSFMYFRKENCIGSGSTPIDRTEAKGRRPLRGSHGALPSENPMLG